MYVHMCICVVHTYLPAYIHTYIQTYIHTHICVFSYNIYKAKPPGQSVKVACWLSIAATKSAPSSKATSRQTKGLSWVCKGRNRVLWAWNGS